MVVTLGRPLSLSFSSSLVKLCFESFLGDGALMVVVVGGLPKYLIKGVSSCSNPLQDYSYRETVEA